RALVLFEPVLFSLAPESAEGIRLALDGAGAAIDVGDTHAAARMFIDYWMGAGAWDATPDSRKPPIAAAVAKLPQWDHALFSEAPSLAAFAAPDRPVLWLMGERTTASARGVARRLSAVLPRLTTRELAGVGHMGPVSHPEVVNEAIAEFLAGLS